MRKNLLILISALLIAGSFLTCKEEEELTPDQLQQDGPEIARALIASEFKLDTADLKSTGGHLLQARRCQ